MVWETIPARRGSRPVYVNLNLFIITSSNSLAFTDKNVEAALAAAGHKETAYLKQFGQPLLPLRRERRPSYKYQPQLPSCHIESLEQYLSITPSLIPRDPTLSRFCIRHPNLRPDNIFVSRTPDGWKIISIIDWQQTSILPMFLQAGIPEHPQGYGDVVLQHATPPSQPDNLDESNEAQRATKKHLYHSLLFLHNYIATTMECNQLHYAAFTDPMYKLRSRLFQCGGAPWEAESFDLKAALIEATEKWNELTGGDELCPLKFDDEELHKMKVLGEEISKIDAGFEILQSICGVGEDGWVSNEGYERTTTFLKKTKEEGLADADSARERDEIANHWPWDDMDEEMYM
jgi:hypothetical protein